MFIPENELGVIVVFAITGNDLGFEIVSIGSKFPDAVIRERQTEKEYRVEFEYAASNFVAHGHDPRNCDLIICWKNDFPESLLPILDLSAPEGFELRLASDIEKEVMYLRIQNARLIRENNMLKQPQIMPVMAVEQPKLFSDVDIKPPDEKPGWRIEIIESRNAKNTRGPYWQWRRGSGSNREYQYGGKLAELPESILETYSSRRVL
jgi:hypothetical protein